MSSPTWGNKLFPKSVRQGVFFFPEFERIATMNKDFDSWNEKKKKINDRKVAPFYHPRELWWCSLGINVGFEQDGSGEENSRPILILTALSKETFIGIPLTTSSSEHRLRPPIGLVEEKEARALLSQIKVIDTKRLIRKIGQLDKKIFENIRKIAKDML